MLEINKIGTQIRKSVILTSKSEVRMMCSKEELIRQLIAEASVLSDEEIEEVLEYAKQEFAATVGEGEKEVKKKNPAE